MTDRNAGKAHGMWGWLVRNAVLPIGDRLWGQAMMQRLRFLEEAQWWPRERLIDYRKRKMQETLQTAFTEVPFYRDLFTRAAIRPEQIQTAEDLQRLPVVTKDMLREVYPDRLVRYTGQPTYEECSSGSTGAPFCVTEDADTAGWHRASFMLTLEWAGWRIGMPYLQTGITPSRRQGRRLKDLALRCHYASAYDLADAQIDGMLSAMRSGSLRYAMGYPGSMYYLAERARATGWDKPLQGVVTWGDNLFEWYREEIEEVFQTRVFDTYGCGEGVQVAAQCGTGMTYHIHMLDVIVEYLDDDDQPVPAGQPGNLVLTRLHAGPTPLIRYKIGDIGVSGGVRRCECGRGFDVMESIQGRNTDVIVTPDGNRLIVHFFTGILEHYPQIDTFQIVQEDAETLTMRLKPRTELSPEQIEEIIRDLKDHGAQTMTFNVTIVDEIPLTSAGKRRFVINRYLERGY